MFMYKGVAERIEVRAMLPYQIGFVYRFDNSQLSKYQLKGFISESQIV